MLGILSGLGRGIAEAGGGLSKSQQLLGRCMEATSHLLGELGLLKTDLKEMQYHRVQVGGVGFRSVSDAHILHQCGTL